MGWSERFDDPIPLPSGRTITRLDEARAYLLTLPQTEQDSPPWQSAAHYLSRAAEAHAWMQFARRAVYAAIHGESEPKPTRPTQGEVWRAKKRTTKANAAG